MSDDRAAHSFPDWAEEETCKVILGPGMGRCGTPAAHKVEETSGPSSFHPMTAYICCHHFTQVVGQCATYPYDHPER